MTGAFLRVRRHGKFIPVEVERLTREERSEKLREDPRLMEWLHIACESLVEAEDLLEGLVKDGVLEKKEA
jgi:hypothetical protein